MRQFGPRSAVASQSCAARIWGQWPSTSRSGITAWIRSKQSSWLSDSSPGATAAVDGIARETWTSLLSIAKDDVLNPVVESEYDLQLDPLPRREHDRLLRRSRVRNPSPAHRHLLL